MAQKLPSKGLKRILHITLFSLVFLSGIQLKAQSVLLPGDIVVVSVHADTQAVDIIPLIDIEEGTELYLSDGSWNDSTSTLSGNELKITFLQPIQAGTNIHINQLNDDRISISGALAFSGDTHYLFAYQKDGANIRFIYGVGWGERPIWKHSVSDSLVSDIPEALNQQKDVLLTLGNSKSNQYYVKNGASGTRSMLLNYVGDASHWRGNDRLVYPAFGTSFKLLEPPVVLFQNSVSTVIEDDSIAILNVAIYGHDGSRLTIDVAFDSLRSTASYKDISDFKYAKLNFTGLVGDAVYEVRVPVIDDETFEGRESGIFNLRNLTKGNFGDFLTHSLIIQDNDEPELILADIQHSANNQTYAEILNEEDVAVSLKGWSLVTQNEKVTFNEDVYIEPQQSIYWVDGKSADRNIRRKNFILSDLQENILQNDGGTLSLVNPSGEVISQQSYAAISKEERQSENSSLSENGNGQSTSLNVDESYTDIPGTIAAASETPKTGWRVFSQADYFQFLPNDKIQYSWDKEVLKLKALPDEITINKNTPALFVFFNEEELDKLAAEDSLIQDKATVQETLEIQLSAIDKNENELIDGLEGLNLAVNKLAGPVSVNRLTELLTTRLEAGTIEPEIFGIQKDTTGEINFVKLYNEDHILPGAAFWVMLNVPVETQIVEISQSELIDNAQQIETEEPDFSDRQGRINLWIEAGEFKDSVEVVITDSVRGLFNKDLNSYADLFLPHQSFINAAFIGGDDFYNKISVTAGMQQQMIIPLKISTSQSGILSFNTISFEDIPSDWKIQLEDKTNEKFFDLRKDAIFNFKHSLPVNDQISDTDSPPNPENYSITDRFYLHISPPASGSDLASEETDEPRKLELHQNFPNPFNPVTTISFYLPEAEEIKLSVFNIVGQPVAVITEGSLSPGEHQFEWDATDKPSGMYIYQLEVGKSVMTRKMTLVK